MSEIRGWYSRVFSGDVRVFRWILLLLVCAFSAALFLIVSAQYNKIGFPLDDAWIHQTYARNLIQYRQWVYIPGLVSAGSTSPLWTVLLSIAYLISTKVPYIWTFLLGGVSLFGLALAGENIFRALTGGEGSKIPWAGIFLATEWHLVWGSVSGMETILFAALILATLVCLTGKTPRYLLAGVLAGVSAWVRPDGITLLGPAIFLAVMLAQNWRAKVKSVLTVLAGFAIPFAGYLLFNISIAGNAWPNTFYAKQAEYAVMINQPFLSRLGNLAALPLIGAGSILIPGFIISCWKAVQRRDWKVIALILWWLGYTLIYALRLPVTYQHGRYLIPAMPVFFILGLVGISQIVNIKYTFNRVCWFAGKVILVSLIGAQLVFGIKGAVSYGQDVAIIESEMVATANWLKDNTPPDAIIAAHDIGAIGFFSQRRILDLAGLVSPEVIPFIRDEMRLAVYLDEQKATYLVTFPDWYPYLVTLATPIHQTSSTFATSSGGENMTIYRWR